MCDLKYLFYLKSNMPHINKYLMPMKYFIYFDKSKNTFLPMIFIPINLSKSKP